MPTARIVTSDPHRAEAMVRSLAASGYQVEVVAPDHAQTSACDLVIDLDQYPETATDFDPKEAASYFVDGRETVPGKREFVLAPMWRQINQTVGAKLEHWRQLRAARAEERRKIAIQHATERSQLESHRAAERANVEAELAVERARIEAERQVQAAELARLHREVEALRERSAPPVPHNNPPTKPAAPGTPRDIDVTALWREARQRASTLAAMIATAAANAKPRLKTTLAASMQGASKAGVWARDFTVRPSVSIAAGILFAFLLGYWAATGTEERTAGPTISPVQATVSEASVVTPAEPKQAAPAQKVTARKPSPVKQSALRRAAAEEDDFDEVVVRHYPKRGTLAKTQETAGVKQISDLDDEEDEE